MYKNVPETVNLALRLEFSQSNKLRKILQSRQEADLRCAEERIS